MRVCALTTADNPYDYFDDYDNWLNYDELQMRYNTNQYLARVLDLIFSKTDALTDGEYDKMVEEAIDIIVKYDPFQRYIKVERDIED